MVADPDEKKALRRAVGPASRRSSAARISATCRLGPLPLADLDERAGDRADHVVQEAVGLDVDPDEVVHPVHGDVRDRPDAAGAVGPVWSRSCGSRAGP